jgi:hypothetical protein
MPAASARAIAPARMPANSLLTALRRAAMTRTQPNMRWPRLRAVLFVRLEEPSSSTLSPSSGTLGRLRA